MTVFEYSSVFIAILAGQAVKEILQRMVLIMKQDRWIRRLYAEWLFMLTYFLFFTGQFFDCYIYLSDTTSLTFLQFLVPVAQFSSYYFLSCFAPCPHPNENILDIEGYFAVKLPRAIHVWGITQVPLLLSVTLVNNPTSLFTQLPIGIAVFGLTSLSVGFALRILIGSTVFAK